MLHIESLKAGYGQTEVLAGIDLDVGDGEVVALMGRNGMGKTTAVHCVLGEVRPTAGEIVLDGRPISGLPSYRIAQSGIGLVPEGRHVFPTLTVLENLIATAANYGRLDQPWTVERIYGLFPQLRAKEKQMAGTLSGGEQQMLAIGRALMLSPKLLILDEATEGIAPLIRDEIWSCLQLLKQAGQSILVIDKNLDEMAAIVERCYVMEKGRIVWQGATNELLLDDTLRISLLGI